MRGLGSSVLQSGQRQQLSANTEWEMNSHQCQSHSPTGAQDAKSGIHQRNYKPKYLPAWMGFWAEDDGVIINKQPALRERFWEVICESDCGVERKK